MPPFYDVCFTFVVGCLAGILYGLAFIAQRKRALGTSAANITPFWLVMHAIGFSLARQGLLALACAYVLLSTTIPFILLVLVFLASFWLTILAKGFAISWKDLFF